MQVRVLLDPGEHLDVDGEPVPRPTLGDIDGEPVPRPTPMNAWNAWKSTGNLSLGRPWKSTGNLSLGRPCLEVDGEPVPRPTLGNNRRGPVLRPTSQVTG